MGRIAAVAALSMLALLMPAGARASQVDRLGDLGDRVFGPAACGHVRTVLSTRADALRVGAGEEAVGWAWLPAEAPLGEECAIHVLRSEWQLMPVAVRCQVWLHERGHIAGLSHSHNARSIMNENVDDDSLVRDGHATFPYIDRRCRSLSAHAARARSAWRRARHIGRRLLEG